MSGYPFEKAHFGVEEKKKALDRNLPGRHAQEAIDERGLKRSILEVLHERRLVESNASREGLGDDALAFGDQLGSEPKAKRRKDR